MNNYSIGLWFLISVFGLLYTNRGFAAGEQPAQQVPVKIQQNAQAFEVLNIARQKPPGSVVTVAVVDDGFRLTHKSLNPYLFINTKEIKGNYRDDDLNGYIDDMCGWDTADGDNDVSIPKGKEEILYHGTYITGIITSVFERFFGDEANRYLRIIPIKAVADNTKNTLVTHGYQGIRYAMTLNPDIICCAWSGGTLTEEDKKAVGEAVEKGILVIGSAGNFSTENILAPASLPGVICVAAVDSAHRKAGMSNYGMEVDVVAPGTSVYGAFPVADNAFIHSEGTSAATALMAGCFAALKVINPQATAMELLEAVKNTALPIDELNLTYAGKLGAGVPDLALAIDFLQNPKQKNTAFNPARPKGDLFFSRKKGHVSSWNIHPAGAFKGMHIIPASLGYKGNINIYSSDSLAYSGKIAGLTNGFFATGSSFRVEIQSHPKPSREMTFGYYMQTMDSTTLYCSGTEHIQLESGVITDNSGNENYANHSSCKWQITVPDGKRIRIDFIELDTQPNVDYIWIFDGTSTLPDNLLAKFSGNNVPPIITTLTNEALIWFVTDSSVTGKGWKLKYETVEKNTPTSE